MRARLALFAAILCSPAHADSASGSQVASATLPGTYTVATLPPAAANQARYAFVTDLGGGADMVLSDGAFWKHIRQGVVTTVAATMSVTLTPLVSPPIVQFTGSGGLTAMNVTIAAAGLYPGETFRLLTPSGVLSTLGTFGIGVAGVAGSLPLALSSWQDVQWNGTALVKIAGGTL